MEDIRLIIEIWTCRSVFFGGLGSGLMVIPVVFRRISQHQNQQYHIRKPGCFGEPPKEYPKDSVYAIFTYIYHFNWPNAGKYAILY